MQLSGVLPTQCDAASQLDKMSTVRLAVAYLKLKRIVSAGDLCVYCHLSSVGSLHLPLIYSTTPSRFYLLPVFVCLLARLLKNTCMDLDEMSRVDRCRDMNVGTNRLTFEPDPDHSLDAGTRLLSAISYRLENFAALPRLPASCAAMRNFTSGKSHVYVLAGRC